MRATTACPRTAVRRLAFAVIGTALLQFSAAAVWAQNYPHKPVRLIVPFPAAGQVDAVARLAASKLATAFGKQFVVDNRPGAGGNLGTDVAGMANPDGYTLLAVAASFATNPSVSAHARYDPRRSFSPVHRVASASNVLAVHPSFPAKSVKELVALSRARPGEIACANNGIGTPPHLAAELFSSMAKVQLLHVPYKGGAEAIIDLLAGRVSAMFIGIAPALPMLAAGKLRPIATTGLRRASALLDVPTIAEGGLPGFEIVNWTGILAPAGTQRSIVERLHNELLKAFAQPESKEQLAKLGLDSATLGPNEFGAFIESELVKWSTVAKQAGVSINP
jgi:tripartite-type tricarboxylate transporter receptor subunit TctC